MAVCAGEGRRGTNRRHGFLYSSHVNPLLTPHLHLLQSSQHILTALCPAVISSTAAIDPAAPSTNPAAAAAQFLFLLLFVRCYWIGSMVGTGLHQPHPAMLLPVQLLTVAATLGGIGPSCRSQFMQHPQTVASLDNAFSWLQPLVIFCQPLLVAGSWSRSSTADRCAAGRLLALQQGGRRQAGRIALHSLLQLFTSLAHFRQSSSFLSSCPPPCLTAVHVTCTVWGAAAAAAVVLGLQLRSYRGLKMQQAQQRRAVGLLASSRLEPGMLHSGGSVGGRALHGLHPIALRHALSLPLVAGEWQYAAAWQVVQGVWQQVDAKWLCLGGAAYLKLWQLHALVADSSKHSSRVLH